VLFEEPLLPRSPITGATGLLLPEGTERPADIPEPIFRAALDAYLGERRLDMGHLAAEIGIGRATLYRKVGSRDRLLGEVAWFLTRGAIDRALRDTAALAGRQRVLSVLEHVMRAMSGSAALRRFLEAEPEAALRVLTSKDGAVQGGIMAVLRRLLARELGPEPRGMDVADLSYAIVRIGEGFVYTDVIGHGEPDVDAALAVIAPLLGGEAGIPHA
jgi:AcrR family transcriptional regulator